MTHLIVMIVIGSAQRQNDTTLLREKKSKQKLYLEKPKENENLALRFHRNNYCFRYCFVTVVLKLDTYKNIFQTSHFARFFPANAA